MRQIQTLIQQKAIEAPGEKRSGGNFGNALKTYNNPIKIIVTLKDREPIQFYITFNTTTLQFTEKPAHCKYISF